MAQALATMVCLWLIPASALPAAHPAGGDFEGVPLGKLPSGWQGDGTVVTTGAGQC